jgi:protein-tyrosine phosphatase
LIVDAPAEVLMILDAHTHILPNIDDGAASTDEALTMMQATSNDCDMFFLTPHFYPHERSLEDFLHKRNRSVDVMRPHLLTAGAQYAVGCEVYLSPLLFKNDDLSGICIGSSRYALIEMPFLKTWGMQLFEMLDVLLYEHKYIPIIAHVERYLFFRKNPDVLDMLIRKGCLVQLNAESVIASMWGRDFPMKLLKSEKVHLLGSDCHNMSSRKPNLQEARTVILKKLGACGLQQIDEVSARVAAAASSI